MTPLQIRTSMNWSLKGVAIVIGVCAVPTSTHAARAPDFEAEIAPLLIKRCLECHNQREAAGGLALTTRDGLLAGGESGVAVVPEHTEESYLFERVASGEMPPEKKGQPQPLPPEEIELLRGWIAAGATWPAGRKLDQYEVTTDVRGGRDWWSLQPVSNPPVPTMQSQLPLGNPIDAFILSRLEAQGLQPAPQADRRTLVRRLYFDLLGLPPSPDEIQAFVADDSPQAYVRLVDRLLASPQFGERWGRYWLDLVRFAETCGYERDQTKPGVWKYRDWVIDALNSDKPFDKFVLEQLAGDELPYRSEGTVIATGFLRLGTWNDEPNDPQEYKFERLEDMVHATSSAFLAMTVKCARCHDHKFDPIPQRDYYRMAASFWAGPIEPGPRELLGGPNQEQLGYDVFGWTDRSRDPPPLNLLSKGDPHRPGDVVEAGLLSMVAALERPFEPPPDDAKTTRRRLQLARWIVDRENPLTARVLVNRLWQHHFGAGIVRSPNNFGFTGDQPTHPQLLDWLAQQLLRADWQMKPLHRLIVTSQTYRQASVHPRQAEYDERDFANRLWWRSNRRRLEAEALRDAMLAVNGQIDMRMAGPSFKPEVSPEALEGLSRKTAAWEPSPAQERNRRSVYIFSQRSLLVPLMTTFDFSDTTLPCAQRDVTTVAPQALALLNNRFVHQQSTALAQRVRQEAGEGHGDRIKRTWQLALGRLPTATELGAAESHLRDQRARFQQSIDSRKPETPLDAEQLALASLCHVLLNSNEFIYID